MRIEAGGIQGDAVAVCCFSVGEASFAIDTRQIREVLGKTMLHRVPLTPEFIAGVVPYRGEVLTAVCFRALLGLERTTGPKCVLVFDDEENQDQRFGLVVDGVGGVATLPADALEANPSALDRRSMALFDGAYKMPDGLMVRLDPQRLRPMRLAASGLFSARVLAEEGDGREQA